MRLENKAAIITGAAHGIGRALAVLFAAEGADLLIADIDGDALERTAREAAASGRKVTSRVVDVTDAGQVAAMVAAAMDSLGQIDILVNDAGGSGEHGVTEIEEIDEALWDRQIDLNLKSVYLVCRAVTPHMKRRGGGAIVNFSSSSAFGAFGSRGTSGARLPYAAAKGGVLSLTVQLAKDLGPSGIRVNAVIPGFILTEPDARVARRYTELSPQEQAQQVEGIPLGRPGRPDEVAKVVLFLASDDASYVSGTAVQVTGARLGVLG